MAIIQYVRQNAVNCPTSLLTTSDVENLAGSWEGANGGFEYEHDLCLAEAFFDTAAITPLGPPHLSLGAQWERVIGKLVIPYSETNRRNALQHAYRALEEYFEEIRAELP